MGRVHKSGENERQDQSSPGDSVRSGVGESEQRFRSLVEGSIEGILVQRDDKILFANQALADILGFDSVADLMQIDSVDAYIHPDDLVLSRQYRSERMGGATPPADYELRAVRKDGSAIWLSCRATVIDWDGEPASQSFHYDIAERKRAEQAERRHREELERLVLERTDDLARERDTLDNYMSLANAVFMVLDPQGRIRLINRHALELLGYSEGEVIGRNWFDMMVPEVERPRRVAIFEAGVRGKGDISGEDAFARESPVITRDGAERLWSWRNRLFRDDSGQVMALVCTAEDVTERRRYEAELQQLRRVETLGAVSAGIAHSLGNLLQPIMALTDLIMNNLGDEERNWKRLQAMSKANSRARTLIDRLLAFSRRDKPSWQELDLNEMMHQVFSLYRYSLPKQITLEENLCETPCKIYADPIQLESVLLNLVNNAAAAIGDNSGRIAVTLDCAATDIVRISIEDDGPGMAPEVHEQAFQPFFTTKQAGEGAGLGLAMVKSTVDEYRGSVRIESEPGKGTRVALVLPRRITAAST